MTGRFWLAVILVFVALFVMDFVIHMVLLSDVYEATASLWRAEEDMNSLMPIMLIGTLVMALFFVLIFGKGYEGKGIGEGFRFGLYVGLLIGVPMGLGTYSSMPIPFSLALSWMVATLVECVVVGLLAAAVYKPARA
jgi:hypothetical protein